MAAEDHHGNGPQDEPRSQSENGREGQSDGQSDGQSEGQFDSHFEGQFRITAAVFTSVQGCDDRAAVELALKYAAEIDAGGDLSKLGPALLAVLEALHLTPRARAAVKGGLTGAASSPLDELRERRARRDRTEAVDAAAP